MTQALTFLSRIKVVLRAFWISLSAHFRKWPRTGKTVLFDLHDIDSIPHNSYGRLTYLLAMLFHENGYTLCFRPNWHFTATFAHFKYKNMIHSLDPVFTWSRPEASSQLCITDRPDARNPGQILLDYAEDLSPAELGQRIAMPYVMHPLIYRLGMHRHLDARRSKRATMRLFFGGNMNPELYDDHSMSESWGKLSRIEVIRILNGCLAGRRKREIRSLPELQQALEVAHDGFSWISGPGVKVPVKEWLDLLAHCDFFLACPGVSKPMCHNCVEAMSVGAIPVLEYPEFFHPPLVHGVNCLVFDGGQDLVEKVEGLFSMDRTEIDALRQGVIDYYESNLSPEAFGQTIEALEAGDTIAFSASKIAGGERVD